MIKLINDFFIEWIVAFGMDAETFVNSSNFGNFEVAVMETFGYDILDTDEYKNWLKEIIQ